MPIVTVDLSQFSGETPGLEPDNGSVWFWPYRPYVEDSSLVSREVVKIKTVDGVATPVLPETPLTEAVWVQLRAVKGAGTPWLVQIPATDCNLFDLDHLDPETLDPTVPPSAAWIAALAAEATARGDADALLAPKASPTFTGTVSGVTKTHVGLSSVDNTSDADKPVSIAQAAADALKVTAPTSPTDGQLVQWNNTLGAWVAVNPTGNSEIAAASNVSNTPQTITAAGGVGTAIDITGMSISVPNSGGRAVSIRYGAGFKQTAVGLGSCYLNLIETTSGSVNRGVAIAALPNTIALAQQTITIPLHDIPIGVVTTTRTFKLQAFLYAPASNNPQAQIFNGSTIPSLLKAIAG